jgi:F-type H+-transporting ATPase subunit b
VLIDWFTVGAQVVNFLVLVWLLHRFLYGPITRAMRERQERIDATVDDARRLQDEAVAERERLRDEHARFAAERDERTRRLHEEIDDQRRSQLERVRREVDDLRTRWHEAVDREREGFLLELRTRAGEQVVAAVRRALRELADVSLEERTVLRFVDRIGEADDDQRRLLASAAASDGDRVVVRSAFAVPDGLEKRLEDAVGELLGGVGEVRFEVAPELIGGVELRAGGHALSWTFDEYLDSLEAALADVLGTDWQSHGRG